MTPTKKSKKTKNATAQSKRPAPLPDLSHLQFLVLGILLATERRGIEIRDQLTEFGVKKSGPAFYQLMARLEDAELVKGRYRQEIIDAQIIRERVYKVTTRGQRSWERSRDFQLNVIERLGPKTGGAYAYA